MKEERRKERRKRKEERRKERTLRKEERRKERRTRKEERRKERRQERYALKCLLASGVAHWDRDHLCSGLALRVSVQTANAYASHSTIMFSHTRCACVRSLAHHMHTHVQDTQDTHTNTLCIYSRLKKKIVIQICFPNPKP